MTSVRNIHYLVFLQYYNFTNNKINNYKIIFVWYQILQVYFIFRIYKESLINYILLELFNNCKYLYTEGWT